MAIFNSYFDITRGYKWAIVIHFPCRFSSCTDPQIPTGSDLAVRFSRGFISRRTDGAKPQSVRGVEKNGGKTVAKIWEEIGNIGENRRKSEKIWETMLETWEDVARFCSHTRLVKVEESLSPINFAYQI